MVTSNNINLLQSKAGLPPQIVALEKKLRLAGYFALAILIFLGVSTAISYFYLQNQKNTLTGEKTKLTRRIDEQKQKEGLLLSVRQRLATTDKILINQSPWAQTLEMAANIALPPKLNAIAIDEQNKTSLTLEADSLEETLEMVNTLINTAQQKRLQNPELVSLQLDKNGEVQITLSFIPVFARQ